jgi:hypothetical protein
MMGYISSTNAIPTMTSNTAPSGVASAGSIYSAGFDAYKAFDKSTGTYWQSNNKTAEWIAYQFTNPIVISKYSITCEAYTSAPKSWTFEGSNDGINWVVLDTRTNVTWSNAERKEWEIPNRNKYFIYRINITSVHNYTSIQIREIEMFEYIFINKILIQLNDGGYISVENGGYTNDLVPKLTSNTDVLYSSSFNSTGFEAYKAFDDDGTTGVQTNSGANPNGLYIGYDFKTKVKISAYRLKCRGTSTTRMIKKWDFQGSDDGVVWNTIDSRSNVTDWVADTFKTFDLPQQVEYKMYRIYVYENNGDASYTSIGEIEFIDKNSSIVKLLTSSTEQDLIDYGMDKSTVLDLSQTISRKSFIEKNTTTLGSGKVFSKSIDTTQLPIKKLTIK